MRWLNLKFPQSGNEWTYEAGEVLYSVVETDYGAMKEKSGGR